MKTTNWKISSLIPVTMLNNKDGTYTRVNTDGKQNIMWTKIANGKDL